MLSVPPAMMTSAMPLRMRCAPMAIASRPDAQKRLIVNPGSVGLQFNIGSPDARYATIELRGGKYYPSFHAVPYDHFAAARQAEANGFPQWREALVTGWAGAQGLF